MIIISVKIDSIDMLNPIKDQTLWSKSITDIIDIMFINYPWISKFYRYLKEKYVEFWMWESDFEGAHIWFKQSLLWINDEIINKTIDLESQKTFIETLMQQNIETYKFIQTQEERIYKRELEKMEKKHEASSVWSLIDDIF